MELAVELNISLWGHPSAYTGYEVITYFPTNLKDLSAAS